MPNQVISNNGMFETIKQKRASHSELTLEEIKYLAPAAAKQRMIAPEITKLGLSKQYVFVPTTNVINDLKAMGWYCVDAQQVKARKGGLSYSKHLLKFENDNYKTEGTTEYPQLLLTNSHNGGNAFSLSAGIFRLVCSNGLVIKTEDYGTARLIHKGYSTEAVLEMVNGFIARIDETLTGITAMKETQLTADQMLQFAVDAARLRMHKDKDTEYSVMLEKVSVDEILNSIRPEDNGNGLWEVYNRVQENLVKGKYHYQTGEGDVTKTRKARPIKSFQQDMDVNKKLSELALQLVA